MDVLDLKRNPQNSTSTYSDIACKSIFPLICSFATKKYSAHPSTGRSPPVRPTAQRRPQPRRVATGCFVLAAELLVEQRLGWFAVRTEGLAEEGDVVRVDDALCLCLCGGHGGGNAGGMEVAKKPQRIEAMVAVFIEVSLSMLVKPINGHINGNGSDFKLSGVYKKWRQQLTSCVNPRL